MPLLVDSADDEFTNTEEETTKNPILDSDQEFLSSLMGGDDDVPEDEIGDDKEEPEKKVEEPTPDFDESDFMFK